MTVYAGEQAITAERARLAVESSRDSILQSFGEVGFGETVGAAFRLENPIVSWFVSPYRDFTGADEPGFDAFVRAQGTVLDDYPEMLADVHNEHDFQVALGAAERELRDKRALRSAGALGVVTAMGAGSLDPIVFLPVAGVASKFVRGTSLLSGAVRTALAGGISASLSEAELQSQQVTRTWEESALNITGATLLSGVLGGAVAGLSRREFNQLAAGMADDADPSVPRGTGGPDDALVLDVPHMDAGATQIELEKAFGVERAAALLKTNRAVSTMVYSPYESSKQLVSDLFETIFRYKGGIVPTPGGAMETAVKGYDGRYVNPQREMISLWVNYRRALAKKKALPDDLTDFGLSRRVRFQAIRDTLTGAGDDGLRLGEFRILVGRAIADDGELRPGVAERLVGSERKGLVAKDAIEAAAKRWSDDLFGPFFDDLVDLGRLPADFKVKGALAYLSRIYKKDLIGSEVKGATSGKTFRQTLIDWMQEEAGVLEPGRTDADIEKAVDEVIDSIMGWSDARIGYDRPGVGSALGQRVLDIPTHRIEDFLEFDIERIGRRYMKTMAFDVEYAKYLRERFPDATIDDLMGKETEALLLRELKAEFEAKRGAAPESERKGLFDAFQRDKESILGMLEMLRTGYVGGSPYGPMSGISRGFQNIRRFNLITQGGGFPLISTTDVGRIVMRHGIKRAFGDALVPLVTHLSDMKLLKRDLRDLFEIGLEVLLDSRSSALFEVGDDFGQGGRFTQAMARSADEFMFWNGMHGWNAWIKRWAGVVTHKRMVEAIEAAARGKARRKDLAWLRANNFDDALIAKVAGQLGQHKVRLRKGFALSGWDQWGDEAAKRAFKNALRKEVDAIIVTPGAADLPLLMGTEPAKVLFQYKSFAMASVQRSVLPAAQEMRNLHWTEGAVPNITGALIMTTMGMGVYAARTIQAGRGEELQRVDLDTWIREGLDRSGAFIHVMEPLNILDKMGVGPQRWLGGPAMSRYASRGILSSLLGPSAGLAERVFTIAGGLTGEEGSFSRGTLREMRRLMPIQNVWYLQNAFNVIEGAAGDVLGLPERRSRRGVGGGFQNL